jgi:hypothetical protein
MVMRSIWLAGVVLAAALTLTGCTDSDRPSPTAPPTAWPTSTPDGPPANAFTEGHGLEIRYLAEDGTIKIMRPEDFPR